MTAVAVARWVGIGAVLICAAVGSVHAMGALLGRVKQRATAPSSAHRVPRALAARQTWVDEQGDHFAVPVAPVAEVVPFVEPHVQAVLVAPAHVVMDAIDDIVKRLFTKDEQMAHLKLSARVGREARRG